MYSNKSQVTRQGVIELTSAFSCHVKVSVSHVLGLHWPISTFQWTDHFSFARSG